VPYLEGREIDRRDDIAGVVGGVVGGVAERKELMGGAVPMLGWELRMVCKFNFENNQYLTRSPRYRWS
jgi:hypothetical protein